VKGGPGFNVSHCEELVAVAICGEEVGIDVERVRGAGAGAELDFVGMARAGLRGEDVEAVAGSDVGERAGIFFERWVAHEARVKLEGRGLGGVGTGEVWRLELGDGWKGALAMARGGGVGVEMRDFRF
jgi:phosphopantetheinyl transferase